MGRNNYENKIVSLLLGYYRRLSYENTNDNVYLIKNFISFKSKNVLELCSECVKQCKNKNSICSADTIRRIEKGDVAKNTCYYIDFASKIHKKYHKSYKDTIKVNSLSDQIYDVLYTNDKNILQSILKDVDYFLEQKKDVLYYSEILSLFQVILNFQLYASYPDKKSIDLFEFLAPYLKSKERLYASILLYNYYTLVLPDNGKSSFYFYDIVSKYPSFLEYNLIDMADKLEPIDYYNYLKHMNITGLNQYEMYTVLQRKSYAAVVVEKYSEAYEYICESIRIIESDKSKFPELEMIKSCLRKGLVSFQLRKYNEALEDFKKVFLYDINYIVFNLFLFMECFEKLGRREERKAFLTMEYYRKIKNPKIKAIFKYYQKLDQAHSKAEYKDVADYICTTLKPFIRDKTFYHKILFEDLTFLCDETSSYRYIRDFTNYDKEHGYEDQ